MNFYYCVGYHLSRLAGRWFFRLRVIHRERMIQSGPVILAMNHQSYLDPPLAGTTCDRPIYFLARRTLLDIPLLGWVLPKVNVIPVNQEGVDRAAIKALIRVLQPILFSAADLETPGKSLYAGLSDRVMKAISALRLE
ncbi:MAG: hypothetical protein DME58_06245 [Verrucomicrobia bacterium]|nr:MAG: hypothetical protein DME58_06245 [Verrucomicrobiota bacterium]